MKTLKQLNLELKNLKSVIFEKRIIKLMDDILLERKPQIESVEAEIESLRSKRPRQTPRWPENTPPNILAVCDTFWSGTTEWYKYRIHLWNSKAVWTSYPSGGYSNNMGWNPTPCCYELVNLNEADSCLGKIRGKSLATITGRTSQKQLKSILIEKTEKPATSNNKD